MLTLDRVIIGLFIVAVVVILWPRFAPSAVTTQNVEATKDVLDSIVGESPELGSDPTGIAIMTANQGWMFPPPLRNMLPIMGVMPAGNAATGGCNGDC